MLESAFIAICRDLDEEAYEIMSQASKEYASDEDKFANFKGVADFCRTFIPELDRIKPQHVALIFMLKHLISVSKGVSLREDMRGRHKDLQNYARLLFGMDEEDKMAGEGEDGTYEFVFPPYNPRGPLCTAIHPSKQYYCLLEPNHERLPHIHHCGSDWCEYDGLTW